MGIIAIRNELFKKRKEDSLNRDIYLKLYNREQVNNEDYTIGDNLLRMKNIENPMKINPAGQIDNNPMIVRILRNRDKIQGKSK